MTLKRFLLTLSLNCESVSSHNDYTMRQNYLADEWSNHDRVSNLISRHNSRHPRTSLRRTSTGFFIEFAEIIRIKTAQSLDTLRVRCLTTIGILTFNEKDVNPEAIHHILPFAQDYLSEIVSILRFFANCSKICFQYLQHCRLTAFDQWNGPQLICRY